MMNLLRIESLSLRLLVRALETWIRVVEGMGYYELEQSAYDEFDADLIAQFALVCKGA